MSVIDIATKAVEEASAGDEPEVVVETPEGEEAETPEGETPEGEVGEKVELGGEGKESLEPDETDKALEALGIKRPEKGKDNRLPHHRIKRIFANAQKKWQESHSGELSKRDTDLKTLQDEVAPYRRADELIRTNPEAYLNLLASLYPDHYGRFIRPRAEGEKKVEETVAGDPMPEPDTKLADGTLAYSPDGQKKLFEWHEKQAEIRISARLEKQFTDRFGPLEKEFKTATEQNKQLVSIREKIANAKELWGKPFEDDYAKDKDSDILKFMRENKGVAFETAVARVLLPKLQTDRNKMRTELIAEARQRPKAVDKAGASGAKKVEEAPESRSTEDVVRQSLIDAGLIK